MVAKLTPKEFLEQRRKDAAFLNNPDDWPRWPICPVKRWSEAEGHWECGLVFSHCPVRVVRLNMFAGWTPGEYAKAQKHTYSSIETLLDDGWQVD